jgi:hypothetical protein
MFVYGEGLGWSIMMKSRMSMFLNGVYLGYDIELYYVDHVW